MALSRAEGPGTAGFASPFSLARGASFDSYLLRLTASDGELTSSDDVRILVKPQLTGSDELSVAV